MTDSEEIEKLRTEVQALKQTVATTFAWALSAYEFSMVSATLFQDKDVAKFLLDTVAKQIDGATLFSTATEAQLAQIETVRLGIAKLLQPAVPNSQ